MIIVHTVDIIVNPEARMPDKFNASAYVMMRKNDTRIIS